MRRSRLGQDGENVFQIVRAKRTEAQAKGVKLIDLSIGEPRGPALLSARQAATSTNDYRDCDLVFNYSENGNVLSDITSLGYQRSVSVIDGRAIDASVWQ